MKTQRIMKLSITLNNKTYSVESENTKNYEIINNIK